MKALEAAVKARQWNKAVQIVEVLENPEMAKQYYGKIAEHYASVGEYDVRYYKPDLLIQRTRIQLIQPVLFKKCCL